MRLENEHTHYRARFEIFPYDTTDEVAPFVMQVLDKWIREKEWGRNKYRNSVSPVYDALEESRGNYYELHPDKVSGGCYFSQLLLDGLSVPSEYDGGAVQGAGSMICTRSFGSDESSGLPRYWAMDYDEPDTRHRMRRWHTSVGMTCRGSTCVVNVRITNYLTPGFMGSPPEQPGSTTPNFVSSLLSLSGCQTCVGETILRDHPVFVSADNFQSDFVDNLLSSERGLSMVVVVPTFDGRMPVDVDDLALKVLGFANVYTIDYEDKDVKRLLGSTFDHRTPSGKFHLGAGWVRIYEPGVDLNDEGNSRRHRFFRPKDIKDYGAEFNDMLARSLTRSWFQDEGDIIDVTDVETQERRARNSRLRARLDQLGRRADERSVENEQAMERAREAQASNEELRTALDMKDALIEKLREDAVEWRDIANSFADDADRAVASEESERKKTQARIAGYEASIVKLEHDNDDLGKENKKLKYKADAERARYKEVSEELGVASQALNAYETVDHLPTSLSEVLAFVEGAYPDRMVVLKEAFNSAEDFNVHCKIDEAWQIIRSVPTILWGLYFGTDTCADIPGAYQTQAGYELSLNEGSMTNKNDRMMRQRERRYQGETVRIIPHIKGKNTSPKDAFRLHYYVDRERRKIVVGHCGGHLDTAGTRRNT